MDNYSKEEIKQTFYKKCLKENTEDLLNDKSSGITLTEAESLTLIENAK